MASGAYHTPHLSLDGSKEHDNGMIHVRKDRSVPETT